MPFTTQNKRFIPRELSWLSFNRRVLQEAENPEVPLMERLRFLGIFSNNLDEFFRVRVGTIRRLLALHDANSDSGLKPQSILELINETAMEYQRVFDKTYEHLVRELRKHNVRVVNEKQLTAGQRTYVQNRFSEPLLNAVSPIILSQTPRFPELVDKSIYFIVRLSQSSHPTRFEYALVEIPTADFSRFISLPQKGGKKFVMLLDDVVRCCLPNIFSVFDYDIFDAYTIKITRDAEMDVDNDVSQSLVEKVRRGVQNRSKGEPVRFVYDSDMPHNMLRYLSQKLGLGKQDALIPGGRYHNFKDFVKFPNLLGKEFEYEQHEPIRVPRLEKSKSIFAELAKEDVFLYYPYHSFSHYIRLLREAAIDPSVEQIKITLYRVASESKVVRALMNAARNGKQVTAVVELRARFDESTNIYWARKMEEAGVKVVYGTPGLKVHAKMTYFVRRENGREVSYASVSTGNFHEGNANVYTDFSLFTVDRRITTEVAHVFSFIEQPYKGYHYRHLMCSPLTLRTDFMALVDNEIKNAKAGVRASIAIKVNNLVDDQVVEKLYEASCAGVKVSLVVRGMCSLIPGVKGMSQNVQAVSIVDRYLEHSRVFIFANGGKPLYFISSADLMRRNLDQRVEIAVPIFNPKVQDALRHIVGCALSDNVKARKLDAGQKNGIARRGKVPFRSQEELRKYLLTI